MNRWPRARASGCARAYSDYGRRTPEGQARLEPERDRVIHSADGGETWIPEVAVSGEASCPISPRNGTAGMRFPAGGDYHGLAALPDGSFRIVWSDARSGVFELWTNTVHIER